MHPDNVLCHPCNRGGLGINAHNAHRTGAKVQAIGADMKQLDTILFSMQAAGEVRTKQIKFNEEQVKIAEGMLAPVNGRELYTSVSGGHFMAFCKAANAGCKTKVKSIMDEKGYLDAGKLKRDFVFKKLLENGWNCIVINAHAEEIEVCVSMNEFASNMQKIGTEVNWDTCMKAATSGNPPCSSYAKVLKQKLRPVLRW